MLMIIIIILGIISTGIAVTNLILKADKGEFKTSLIYTILWLVSLTIILSIIVSGIGQVDAGYRGVVLEFGKVNGDTKNPGLYFIIPVVNTVEKMDVQTHAFAGDAAAASKDIQDVTTKVTVNYRVNPDSVGDVYSNLRRAYEERVIHPLVQEAVKATTPKFDATELITRREEVKVQIEEVLKNRLSGYGIVVDGISITDFTFSRSFTDSIEAKMVAAQRALEAENKLKQSEVEARQAKTVAEGVANAKIAEAIGYKSSAILRAEGESQAILINANASSSAAYIISNAVKGQKDFLQYTLYKTLGPDIKTIIIPAGQQFILGSEIVGK